jgi:hypothetical protein
LTNEPLGMREMKEAMVKESRDMTFWPVTVRPPDQLALDTAEQSPFPSLQRHLLDEYSGQAMSFEDLLNHRLPQGAVAGARLSCGRPRPRTAQEAR